MGDKLADSILKRLSGLNVYRAKWIRVWNDVARYVMPNHSPVSILTQSVNKGSPKPQPLDTIGIDCRMLLAAFIYSNTVYSGEQWFDLKEQVDKGAVEDRTKSEFLQKLAGVVLDLTTSSNFDHVYRQFLDNYVSFGTGVFFWELKDSELFCRQWSVTDNVFIAENSKGEVDTVFRIFGYTAKQAVEEFGYDNVSEEIRTAYADSSKCAQEFSFVHAVYPRPESERDPDKTTPKNKPFADIYVERASRKVVSVGGRDSFPYCASRFFNMGETYGRSPAMNAIPSLKAVSMATWAYLKNVEFNAKPMVFAPPALYDKVKIEADTVNAWDSAQGDLKIWSPSGDMNSPLDFCDKKKEEIRKLFYVDRIQYLDQKNMTATEAQLRYDEMIQGFSPVLSALQSEFFTPFIENLANEVVRQKLIDIPKELEGDKGLDFVVDYKSRLNAKLKSAFNANILTFVRLIAEYGQAKGSSPLAAVYLNDDGIIKAFAKNCNVLGVALNSDEEIESIKQAQTEQAQMAQAAQMAKIKPIDTQATPAPGSIMDAAQNM